MLVMVCLKDSKPQGDLATLHYPIVASIKLCSIDEERETFDAVCLMFLCIRMGSLRGRGTRQQPSFKPCVALYKMHSLVPSGFSS